MSDEGKGVGWGTLFLLLPLIALGGFVLAVAVIVGLSTFYKWIML